MIFQFCKYQRCGWNHNCIEELFPVGIRTFGFCDTKISVAGMGRSKVGDFDFVLFDARRWLYFAVTWLLPDFGPSICDSQAQYEDHSNGNFNG
jgi:hypothetical protein